MKRLQHIIIGSACVFAGSLSYPLRADDINFGNSGLRFTFSDGQRGYYCKGIASGAGGQQWIESSSKVPRLWSVELKDKNDQSNRVIIIGSESAAAKSFRTYKTGVGEILEFTWRGVRIEPEEGVLDVRCEITLPGSAGQSEWRITPSLRSDRFVLSTVSFPILQNVLKNGVDNVLIPRGTFGSLYFEGNNVSRRTLYPSCIGQVQYAGIFKNGGGGIYIGAHDGNANCKEFCVNRNQHYQDFLIKTKGVSPDIANFPVIISACQSPWEAGRIYRKWALQQKWTAKGKIKNRGDMPGSFKNIDLWLNLSGAPEKVENVFDRISKDIDGRLGIHWYGWNVHKFDTHYPDYFPAKEGFERVAKKITQAGHVVMPYINGRLWDTSLENFTSEGVLGAIKKKDGNIYVEDYHSGVKLAVMCPQTQIFKNKLVETTSRLSRLGVNGVYFDQVAAMEPMPCFDSRHKHALGVGPWWANAYRDIFQEMNNKLGNKLFFASENAAEPYMDSISAFLTWTELSPNDFPSLSQAYSGYARYFCLLSSGSDDYQSFVALQSRSLLWGIQPGWMSGMFEALTKNKTQLERESYIKKIISTRRQVADYISDGELLDEVAIEGNIPQLDISWERCRPSTPFKQRAVSGTIWCTEDRTSLCAIFANISDQQVSFSFRVDPNHYGISSKRGKLFALTEDGKFVMVKADMKRENSVAATIIPYSFYIVKMIPSVEGR